tara:strand:+ start:32507 stop:33052 length:546 start_codon:yes stop_codon:yes gene_type:complete
MSMTSDHNTTPATHDASIRSGSPADAEAMAEIYNHYILNTVVSFEEESLAPHEMRQRIQQRLDGGFPLLVIEVPQQDKLLGFAYASPWNYRSAYRYTAEISIYLAPGASGLGLGTRLYDRLFKALGDTDIKTVIAGITLPNDASVALHERYGLRQSGIFHHVGFKFGQWLDVGYWQRNLNE